MNKIVHVPFNGQTVDAFAASGDAGYYVALRPLCENIGVDFGSQRKRLNRQSWSVTVIMTATGSDGKSYQMLCIDRQTLVMWLATIDASRLKSEAARETVARYQKECAKALDSYFSKGYAFTTEMAERILNDPDTLIGVLTALKAERSRADTLQAETIALAPKAAIADAFLDADGAYTITQASGLLRQLDGSMSRRRLFQLLRVDHMMEQRTNRATARAVERGYLTNIATSFTAPDGERRVRDPYALVTPKGLEWMARRYCAPAYQPPLQLEVVG